MKKVMIFPLFFILMLPLNSFKKIEIADLESQIIVVSVVGEVEHEAEYEVKKGSTINDLLTIVNLNDDADLSKFNLDYVLENQDVINFQAKKTNLISINTANEDLLVLLNGIGEVTAKKIIAYREENGFFKSLNELENIKGISTKTIDKIRDKICL